MTWFSLLAALSLLCPAALGQEAPEDEAPRQEGEPALETVVVATRLPEEAFSSSRTASAVDAEDLSERAPRTTPEALQDGPGVFVQQTNHGGGSPIIRGLIGPQNLILVEGVRLNNSVWRTGPLQYLNMIDPLSLAAVEVLQGPGSVLYGSDAMGGVIQLRLVSPEEPLGPRAEGGGRLVGRFGSADRQLGGHGLLGVQGEALGVVGGGGYRAFGDLTGGAEVGRQEYTGYGQWSAMGHLRWRRTFGGGNRLTLSGAYLASGIEGAGRTDKLADAGSLQFYDNADHLVFARAQLALPASGTDLSLTTSFQHFFEGHDALSLDATRVFTLGAVRDEVTARTFGLDLSSVTTLLDERLRLHAGGLWYRDWIEADLLRANGEGALQLVPGAGAYPDGSTYDTYGVFLFVEGRPLVHERGHELRLAAGYRLHGMGGHTPADSGLQVTDPTQVGHVFQGSVQYLRGRGTNVALTFSQGYRAPNLSEAVMVGDTGKYFHIPNPDLRPERSDTFELVVRRRVWRLDIRFSGYVSLIDDLIRREETTFDGQDEVGGKPVAWNVNAGDGLIWGFEPQVSLAIGWGLSLAGHLTYTWGEGQVGEDHAVPMSRIPPLFGQLTLRYDRELRSGRARAFVETYVRGAAHQDRLSPEDERDARIPEGGTPAWWIWSVRAGVLAPRRFALRLSLDNLLNRTYRYHGSGVDGPGTSATVGLELFF